MNTRRKSTRFAVLGLLLLATVGSLVGVSAAANPIKVAQLAGPWQVAVSGNTGCGVSSLFYKGKFDSIGQSTGTLTVVVPDADQAPQPRRLTFLR